MNADPQQVVARWLGMMLCALLASPAGLAQSIAVTGSGGAPLAVAPCAERSVPALSDLPGLAATALCRQPGWLRAQADVRRRLAERGVALSAWWPSLQLALSARRDTPTPSFFSAPGSAYDHTRQHTLSVNWRLLDAGGRRADLQAAGREVESAIAQLEAVRQSTLAAVALRHSELELAVTVLAIEDEAGHTAQKTLDGTRQRERLGVNSRADVLRAEAALVAAQAARLDAQAALQRAELQLLTEVALVDVAPAALRPLPAGYRGRDAAVERGLDDPAIPADVDQLASVVASRARWQATVERQRAQRSALGPTVDLSLTRSLSQASSGSADPSRPRDTRLGITLNMLLFEGGAGLHRLDMAESEARKARHDHDESRQRAAAELTLRSSELQRTRASHALAVELVAAQAAVRASAEERMSVGAADLDEVLRAQSEEADALRRRAQQFAAVQQARWQWLAASGRMSLHALRTASGSPSQTAAP